jgi:sarcosine oxidase, subunit beta
MSDAAATVVVIGAGIVGASVAYHLAARGCTDVVVLEKAATEATGSTARSAAGVRHQFASEVSIRIYMTEAFPAIPNDIPLTIDVNSGFYLRKEGAKVLFGMSNEAEPPGENLAVDWDWLETVLEAGVARFPALAEAGLAHRNCWAGLYEITPDHMPVLGRHPALPNYVDASGFSGHGIQHAPATGMLIAGEILDGRAHSIQVDELRIARFGEMRLPAESNIY